MSAIWGAISFEKDYEKRQKRLIDIQEKMRHPYDECVIDRFEEKTFENGFFACGLQYFKGNSKYEVLPIWDEDGELFTGDIVLNGRDKLVSEIIASGIDTEKMNIPSVNLEELPDGTLAYIAWKIWKEKMTDHIQGLFAIAVYDTHECDLKIFTDHVGARCIHYCKSGSEIYFSTLIKPILKIMPEKDYGLNEKYIAACEATTLPIMPMYPELTAFQNVFLVPRANYVDAKANYRGEWRVVSKEYWNPTSKEWQKNRKKYKSYSDAQFRNAFRKTLFECVIDAIDTDGGVAATISSGLDSSSIATVAAKFLPKDKNLFCYTAVPIKEYKSKNDGYNVDDETEGVKKIIASYDNIVHFSEDCSGMSAFTEMDKYIHRYEIPGKSFINHIWMDSIAMKARMNGCKVLLNGQFGNYTISNGSIMERVFQEIYGGNIKEAKRQLAIFGKIYGIPRKELLKMILDEIINKLEFNLGIDENFNKLFDVRYVRKDLLKKYRIKNRLKDTLRFNGYSSAYSVERMTRHMFNYIVLQTQGTYDTKLSLYNGIILRDPSRDKRIIEFCSILPASQFTNNALERRLVREYLDDFISDEIRLDVRHRGRQSADMVIRLKLYGEEKRRMGLNEKITDYIDIKNLRELLLEELNQNNAMDTVRILALNSFINEYEKKESI